MEPKLQVNLYIPGRNAAQASDPEFTIKDVRFSRDGKVVAPEPFPKPEPHTLQELNSRLPKGGTDYIISLPVKLLPEKDLLIMLTKTGVIKDLRRFFESVALCSCIQLLNGKNEWQTVSGAVFREKMDRGGIELDPRSVYVKYGSSNGLITPAEFLRILAHEFTPLQDT